MSKPIKNNRKIRNLWLNPPYQRRYIFWLTVSGLFLVALNSTIFYSFTRENYALLVDLSPMTDEVRAQLHRELWRILILLSAASICFIFIMAFMGLIFSHRTVGPLYHFKKTFDQIKSGSTSARVQLRPNDEFQEVAKSFNEMMDTVLGSKPNIKS